MSPFHSEEAAGGAWSGTLLNTFRPAGAASFSLLRAGGSACPTKARPVCTLSGPLVQRSLVAPRIGDVPDTLERETAAYFGGMSAQAAAEENDLENALSAASQEMDFDQA